MTDLFVNICGTIIGGIGFTLLLFFFNEILFPRKNLTGEWKAVLKIENTSYKPIEGLLIEYKIHLLQKGSELSGSGEKIQEIRRDSSIILFDSDKRVQIDINGYYEKKYFRRSKVYFNINEDGRKRESRSTYSLALNKKGILIGRFTSTAANSNGTVEIRQL